MGLLEVDVDNSRVIDFVFWGSRFHRQNLLASVAVRKLAVASVYVTLAAQ
jgi:hypothetical protein